MGRVHGGVMEEMMSEQPEFANPTWGRQSTMLAEEISTLLKEPEESPITTELRPEGVEEAAAEMGSDDKPHLLHMHSFPLPEEIPLSEEGDSDIKIEKRVGLEIVQESLASKWDDTDVGEKNAEKYSTEEVEQAKEEETDVAGTAKKGKGESE